MSYNDKYIDFIIQYFEKKSIKYIVNSYNDKVSNIEFFVGNIEGGINVEYSLDEEDKSMYLTIFLDESVSCPYARQCLLSQLF